MAGGMPRNKLGHTGHRALHAESFSESDAPIGAVWIQILASEALAVFGADPFGLHGLACPWALSSLAIDPQIHPDTAIEPGKHFLCDACSQTARFEIAKSVERTKSRKMNSQFSAPGFWLEFTHRIQWQLCTEHIYTIEVFAHSITQVFASILDPGFHAIVYTFLT